MKKKIVILLLLMYVQILLIGFLKFDPVALKTVFPDQITDGGCFSFRGVLGVNVKDDERTPDIVS